MRIQRTPFRASPALRRAAALACAGVLALPLAACGGSGPGAGTATATSTGAAGATTVSPSTAAATASSSTGAPSGAGTTATGVPAPLTQAEETSTPSAGGDGWVSGTSEGGSASGDAGVVTNLRTGRHEGYDRVVVETSGSGTLSWRAEVTDGASTLGKGDPITVQGGHVLDVLVTGTTMPTTPELQAAAYTGLGLHDVGGPAIKQVWLDGTFEDQFQVVVGTDATEYRVFTLDNPTRLVIDVRVP